MATIGDLSIINSNTAESRRVESGTEATLCSPALCGSKNLTVYKRTVFPGRQLNLQAETDYHLVYVMAGSANGGIQFGNGTHKAEEGAGVLLRPSETVRFE